MRHLVVSVIPAEAKAGAATPRSSRPGLECCALLAVLAWGSAFAQTPTTQPAATQPATQPATRPEATGKRLVYAPGVTIDWSIPQVEVEARVVFREGYLELLLCSRHTKEHESILATDARPKHIYEAMGLIGLEPGRPMRYDPKKDRYHAATGQRLALEIHYRDGEEDRIVAAHEWMSAAESLEPMAAPAWVFCGSQAVEGRFAADVEGTIACVVDFDSALIGLADRHSAKDSELWLVANRRLIPPKGTPCKLVIRALQSDPLVLALTPEGLFLWKDAFLDPLELDAVIRWRTRHYPDQAVELSALEGTRNVVARVAGRCIIGSGIAAENLTLVLEEEEQPPPTAAVPATQPAQPPTTQPAPAQPVPAPTAPKSPPGNNPEAQR